MIFFKKKKKLSKDAKPIGEVVHFFRKIKVAVVRFDEPTEVGVEIIIKGGNFEFSQKIVSMQVDHEQVKKVGKGKSAGIKVKKKVKPGHKVYLG